MRNARRDVVAIFSATERMMTAQKRMAEATRKSSVSHFGAGRQTRSLSHSHGGLNVR